MYLVDIHNVTNGKGKKVYGNRLEAYSFEKISCDDWFNNFCETIFNSIEEKKYFPVYRIADGEFRLLFGLKINWKNQPVRHIFRYVKYEVFKANWETSWGEKYNSSDLSSLSKLLGECVRQISKKGLLAVYWNENGLNAFTEYNSKMIEYFSKININLSKKNYIPFHFGTAIVAKHPNKIFSNRNVLIINGMEPQEFQKVQGNLERFNPTSISHHKCSSVSALTYDYTNLDPLIKPDIVLVAAGIGSAKVLFDLEHLNCPVIDIGGYMNVLSGKLDMVHAGFFKAP